MMRALRRGFIRSQKGQALVEVAFVLPIFVILVLGTVDLGRYIFMSHAVLEAAYEGARVAGVHADPWYLEGPVPDAQGLADARATEVLANYPFIDPLSITSTYQLEEFEGVLTDPSGNTPMRVDYTVSHPFQPMILSGLGAITGSAAARAEISHHEPIIVGGGGEEEEEGGPGPPI